MKELDLITIIGIISAFILLLLASFLFSVTSKNKISNKLFAVFLILFALDITGFFSHLFFHNKPSIFNNLRFLSPSLQIPVFYLYILSVCYSDFKLKKKHLWHLLPYIIINLLFFPRFYLADTSVKVELLENFRNSYEFIISHVFTHIQALLYLIASFSILLKAKKIFTENYSSGVIKTYNWLFQLLVSYSFLYGFAIVKNILKFSDFKELFKTSQIIIALIVLTTICWYVLKALKNPDLFKGVDSKITLAKNLIRENTPNKNIDSEIQVLNKYMAENEPYLNPSLTIRNLAVQMKIPMRDLSVLINQSLNKHFFDFVNEYRIKKAMDILKDSSNYKMTVLEILYEVGFNSKSSFNTAFKKHTQLTPTQFRKKELQL